MTKKKVDQPPIPGMPAPKKSANKAPAQPKTPAKASGPRCVELIEFGKTDSVSSAAALMPMIMHVQKQCSKSW